MCENPDKNLSSTVSPFNFPIQHDLFMYIYTYYLLGVPVSFEGFLQKKNTFILERH